MSKVLINIKDLAFAKVIICMGNRVTMVPEDLSKRSAPDGVHGSRLKIDENGPGHILRPGSLVVVYVDPLQLQV